LAPARAQAVEGRRFALVAGEPDGGPGTQRLRHAERDARRIHAILTRVGGVQEEDARLLLAVADAAATLSIVRHATAEVLGHAVSGVLADLGFPEDAFAVAMGRRPAARDDPAVEVDGDAVALDATGIDTIVFTFRPNPGEPARPLARIASGGELSRVSLAVKQVLAEVDETPVLVFDEIDAGIGGRSADPVGRSLWTLARDHQVLCVTHLPQIAAYADAHYRIAKRERDGRTVTEIVRLEASDREGELAAMLAGAGGGEAALASARELLERAAGWRAARGTAAPA
jgi:DNA repair protein RecN (Recombination protein N)